MITEQEVREKMDASLKEKLHPIVEQMTNLIGKAYEAGVSVGIELGKHFDLNGNPK